jgi:hypothetical protein
MRRPSLANKMSKMKLDPVDKSMCLWRRYWLQPTTIEFWMWQRKRHLNISGGLISR